MKIVDLREGPLDFASGVAGALRSKSKNPKTAAKGKAQMNKAGARMAGSSSGQKAKKKKMAGMMLGKWQDQANIIRSQESREPEAADLDLWLRGDDDNKGFMGKDKELGPAYDGQMKDSHVQKYFTELVDTFYKQKKPGKKPPVDAAPSTARAPAPSASTPTTKQQMPLMIGRDAQQKALAAPTAADNKEAISAFKNYGSTDAEAKMLLKRAQANGANMADVADIVKKAYKKTKTESESPGISYLTRTESLQRAMMSQYLLEKAVGKNIHLEHIEDMVFNQGYEGAQGALTYFEQILTMLASGAGDQAKITVKWDGAPAVICGIDPVDGKFFVGTKSVFNTKDPKVNKTKRDLEKHHGHQPELKAKLALCLKYLPALGIGNVMQGDIMFDTVDEHPVPTTINGEKLLTFGPNTITYAVPIKSDLATKIKRAKLGIVFHTAYDGADLPSMQASFGVDARGYNQTKNVWFDDATYKDLTGTASLTPQELAKITQLMEAAERTMSKIRAPKFNEIMDNVEFVKHVKAFVNVMVKDARTPGNPIAFLNEFMEYYRGRVMKEIEKGGWDEDKRPHKARMKKIKDQEEFLEDHSNALLGVLSIYKRLIEIKLILVRKLEQIEGIGTFVKDGDGYTVTEPEGFVAVGHEGGAIKLVDRLEFSRLNFSNTKDWKK